MAETLATAPTTEAPAAPQVDASTEAAAPIVETPVLLGGNAEPASAEVPTETTEAKADSVVPEVYDWKVPEGMTADPEALALLEPIAKKWGFDNEKANEFASWAFEQKQAIDAQYKQAAEQAHLDKVNSWFQAAKADKEIVGTDLTANLNIAETAFKAFATPELIGLLKETGLVNHPEIVRMFLRQGKAMNAEGTNARGNVVTEKVDSLSAMYSKTKFGK